MLDWIRRVRTASSVRMAEIQSWTSDCHRLQGALNRFSGSQVCEVAYCWEPRSECSICIVKGDELGEDVIVEEDS